MNTISNRFLRLAVLFALCGMTWGMIMGGSENFAAASAHAHLNLLGWVSMTLYGLFYRVVPTASVGKLPHIHFWLALIGFLIFVPSLGVIMIGPKDMAGLGGAGAGIGGAFVWIGMALFAVIVWRATSSKAVV